MPAFDKVIVFGATGAVGSTAALRAYKDGATVSLALRDISKEIPILDEINATRVQADLTQPESVKAAVRQTGSKAAFIYAVPGTPDHMRPAIQALKDSGIEFVVFLSSLTIMTDIREVHSEHFIPFYHAQIEIVLEEVYGNESFVAVRPAYFASNILLYKLGIERGEVKFPNPSVMFDFISTDDIGAVAGALLTSGQRVRTVGLLGPERLSMEDAVGVVGNVLGKQIAVTKVPEKEAEAVLLEVGIPPPVVNWLVRSDIDRPSYFWENPEAPAALINIQKYSKNSPQRFQEWMEINKDKF